MRRLFVVTLLVSVAALVGIHPGAREAAAHRESPGPSSSDPISAAWLSRSDSPVSEALLAGAKALLKDIYAYSAGDPDYLPTSYKNANLRATDYVVHASKPTSVCWKPGEGDRIEWRSLPGGTPRGWSATVAAAGKTSDRSADTQCFTDCSGFITSLFTYANSLRHTEFRGWMKGSSIPEAGCFDPQGGCLQPNPANYYRFFTNNLEGFQSISLDKLMPGNLIAYASTKTPPKATGHIMLVAAVANINDDPQSRLVVVIDETWSPHSMDTRHVEKISPRQKVGAGLGMGIIRLSSVGGELRFYWGLGSTQAEVGSVALGRAR